MKSWVRKGCIACAAVSGLGLLTAVVVGGIFLAQYLSLAPEESRLVQRPPPAGSESGRVVLSLSSAAVAVKAGPAGGPIRVESSFDPEVHRLEGSYHEDGAGGWTYRLDFHERTLLHVSVAAVWLGRRAPEVTIEIPRGLPISLDVKMEGGYLALDLAGLELSAADVELDRGVLGLFVTEPLRVPMERLDVKGRMGTMVLRSLGNASPREVRLRHRIGAAHVDLGGEWLRDADLDFSVAFGDAALTLPDHVRVEGLYGASVPPLQPTVEEIAAPTLRFSTRFVAGDIHVVD